MTDRKLLEQSLEALIENSRILGYTEARQFYVGHSQQDAIVECDMHERISKHSAVLRDALLEEKVRVDESDLLGALEALLNLNDNHSSFGGEIHRDRIDRAWDNARAALAKVRGGK